MTNTTSTARKQLVPGLYLDKYPGKNWGLILHELPDLYLKFWCAARTHHDVTKGRLGIFYQGDSASNHEHIFKDTVFRHYPRDDEFWRQFPNYTFDKLFSYLFVEFWCGDHDLILEHSMQIAQELGVELRTDWC